MTYARYNGLAGAGSSSGVTSLNTLTGDITLAAGANITITPSGQTLTISATGVTSGNLTDAGTDGITITGGTGAVIGSGTSIAQHVADATHNGYLSSSDWSTFNSKQSALTIGNLTDAGTDGITVTGGTGAVIGTGTSIAQHVADATHNGYLSSSDWSTFNGKQSALTIGNLTDAGTDGITITGGTGAVIGSGTSIAQHVADATHNGYLSSSDWSTFNSKQSAGNYITALTGDVTASGPGSVAATLVATSNATLTTLSALTTASSLASVGTITSGTWSATTVAVNKGGSGQTSYTDGQLLIGNSSGNTLSKATLTAGTGIAITNGNGSISIAASGAPALSVTGVKTGAYNIQTTDNVVPCDSSGGTFAVVLPTASGNSGLQIEVKKVDSSFTVVTINTTSSQTIDGVTSTKLATQYESITVVSDGSNWLVAVRRIPSQWATVTPTWTGLGTPSANNGFMRREGDSLRMRGTVTSGTSTAVPLKVAVPNSLTIDSTKVSTTTQTQGVGIATRTAGSLKNIFSDATIDFVIQFDGSDTAAVYFSETTGGTSNALDKNNATASIASGNILTYDFTIPISGWSG